MDVDVKARDVEEDHMELRRGPWTVEEDFKLMDYIATHGEGRWNALARCAGLKRTGKSCRLRWLNYLRPDVRRGNITLQEQLLILQLHSRWGNRWSKIAQHLPGRTDNEIKNYWRTRVQKHAKRLKCDVNSKQFKDTMRYLWIPRLVERIQAASTSVVGLGLGTLSTTSDDRLTSSNYTLENSSTTDSFGTQVSPLSDFTDYYSSSCNISLNNPNPSCLEATQELSGGTDFQSLPWQHTMDASNSLFNAEDIYFLQHQLNFNL